MFTGKKDVKFKKSAENIAYGVNAILAVLGIVTLLDVMMSNLRTLTIVHSLRFVLFLIVSLFTGYAVSKGYSEVDVNIVYYLITLFVVFAINVAVTRAHMKRDGDKWTLNVLFSVGITVFSLYSIVEQLFRLAKSEKTVTINLFWTLLMSLFTMFEDGARVMKHANAMNAGIPS